MTFDTEFKDIMDVAPAKDLILRGLQLPSSRIRNIAFDEDVLSHDLEDFPRTLLLLIARDYEIQMENEILDLF